LQYFLFLPALFFPLAALKKTQNVQNSTPGASEPKNNQYPANGNMMHHHGLHMNGSERPYWNNTSRRSYFNGSNRSY
jgi:hypothetical protein